MRAHRSAPSRSPRTAITCALLSAVCMACGPLAPTGQLQSAGPAAAASSSPGPSRPVSTPASSPDEPSPSPAPTAAPVEPSSPWTPTTARGDNPLITCSGQIGPNDPVAVVTLRDADGDHGETVLRSYASVAEPRTVCTGLGWWTRLLDANHAWTWDCEEGDCAFAIIDLPEARYHWYAMPTSGNGVVQAVAPGFQTIAWNRYDKHGGRELHVADATGDHLAFRFPSPDGRCGSPIDSNLAAFSRSGEYLYYLDQSVPQFFTLVVVGGHEVRFAVEPPTDGWGTGKFPLMAVWSPVGDTLYYRKGSDVFEWTPNGGSRRVLDSVPWLYPTITPDGRHLAYALETSDHSYDVYHASMTNLADATLIARDRTNPVFLNNRQLWYQTVGGGCGGTETPKPRVYDIRTGGEATSIIVSVDTIWPGTSSNH